MRRFNYTRKALTGGTAVMPIRFASSDLETKATFFGYLDKMFSGAAPAVEATSTLSYGASAMTWLQGMSGFEGGVVLLAGGALTRLVTLYASLYGERASWRMVQALPELKPAYDAFQHTYNSDRGNASEVQIGAAHLSAQKKEVFRKYNTSNLKTLAGLVASPLVVLGLRGASQMCDPFNAAGFGSSELLWLTMGAVDPTFILPATVSALTLLNFELTLRNREDVTVGWTRNVVMAARGGAIIGFALASQMNSGVLLYWLGMSLVGVVQPLLVRSAAFRAFVGFPDVKLVTSKLTPSKVSVVAPLPGISAVREKPVEKEDNYRMRFGINHPFLNKLFNPDTEEHLELITRSSAPIKQPTRQQDRPISSEPSASTSPSKVSTPFTSRERTSIPMSHHPNLSKITRPSTKPTKDVTQQNGAATAFTSFDELAGDLRFDPESDIRPPAGTSTSGPDVGASWRATNRKI